MTSKTVSHYRILEKLDGGMARQLAAGEAQMRLMRLGRTVEKGDRLYCGVPLTQSGPSCE